MVVADTSIWISHLRKANATLSQLLSEDALLMHPFVIGELACGTLKGRTQFLALLNLLPAAPEASTNEVLAFIEARKLHGKGIGWVDAPSPCFRPLSKAHLWSEDKSLAKAASSLHISF